MSILSRLPNDVLVGECFTFLDSSTLLLSVSCVSKAWRSYAAETFCRFQSLSLSNLQRFHRLCYVLEHSPELHDANDRTTTRRLYSLHARTVSRRTVSRLTTQYASGLGKFPFALGTRFMCTRLVLDCSTVGQCLEFCDRANLSYELFPILDSIVVDMEVFEETSQYAISENRLMECIATRFGNTTKLCVRGNWDNSLVFPSASTGYIGLRSFDLSNCEMPLESSRVFATDASSSSVCGSKVVSFLYNQIAQRIAASESLKSDQPHVLRCEQGTRSESLIPQPSCPLIYSLVNHPILDFVALRLSVFYDAEAYHQRINRKYLKQFSELLERDPLTTNQLLQSWYRDAHTFLRRQFIDFDADLFQHFSELPIQRVSLIVDSRIQPAFFDFESFRGIQPRLESLTFEPGCKVSELSLPEVGDFSALRHLRIVGSDTEQPSRDFVFSMLEVCPVLETLTLSHLSCTLDQLMNLSRKVSGTATISSLTLDVVDLPQTKSENGFENVRCSGIVVECRFIESFDLVSRLVFGIWTPRVSATLRSASDHSIHWHFSTREIGRLLEVCDTLGRQRVGCSSTSIMSMQPIEDHFRFHLCVSPYGPYGPTGFTGPSLDEAAAAKASSSWDLQSVCESFVSSSDVRKASLRPNRKRRALPENFVPITPF